METPDPSFLQCLLETHLNMDEGDAKAIAKRAWQWVTTPNRKKVDRLFGVCESPLERRLLLALPKAAFPDRDISCLDINEDIVQFNRNGIDYIISPQAETCHGYRADFVLFTDRRVSLVIEVDGHDFHEKTKEQARDDKKRDRAMIAAGYLVVRFTGSEVFANANGCWLEVFKIVETRSQPVVEVVA